MTGLRIFFCRRRGLLLLTNRFITTVKYSVLPGFTILEIHRERSIKGPCSAIAADPRYATGASRCSSRHRTVPFSMGLRTTAAAPQPTGRPTRCALMQASRTPRSHHQHHRGARSAAHTGMLAVSESVRPRMLLASVLQTPPSLSFSHPRRSGHRPLRASRTGTAPRWLATTATKAGGWKRARTTTCRDLSATSVTAMRGAPPQCVIPGPSRSGAGCAELNARRRALVPGR